MFTGLVEEIGTIRKIAQQGDRFDLFIEATTVTEDLKVDDSVNVNGVCLTVVDYTPESFHVQVVPQTIRKSAFRNYRAGERVNLERAMSAGGRFGGHFVQGHVDGTAELINLRHSEDHAELTLSAPVDLLQYCVDQGSIAVDGISLTIASIQDNTINIAVIPHTLTQTNLQYKQPGDLMNIEVDMLSKYVKKHLQQSSESKMSFEWLTEQGF